VRLLEVLAALSLATDLGSGFAPEKGLRTCVAAVAIARQAGLDDDGVRVVLQTSLLRALGCTAFASENAWHFGDDLAFQRDLHTLDPSDPESFARFGAWAGEARGAELRAHFVAIAATVGPQAGQASCEASRDLGTRLGLASEAVAALDQVAERWDGTGFPGVARGEGLTPAARILHVAEQAVLAWQGGGPAAALGVLDRRSGGQFDPGLVTMVMGAPDSLLAALSVGDPLGVVLDVEPPPRPTVPIGALGSLCEAFADLADLKSRYTLGHSRGVAALAARAGGLAGLQDEAVERLRLAALLHDVGRTSVSTSIWERPGRLSAGETDQVRLHPYWSERVLVRAPALAGLGPLAGALGSELQRRGAVRHRRGGPLPVHDDQAGPVPVGEPLQRVAARAHPFLADGARVRAAPGHADVLPRRPVLPVRPDLQFRPRPQRARADGLAVLDPRHGPELGARERVRYLPARAGRDAV